MIANITSGASVFGALSYNYDKVKEGTASIIHTNNMICEAGNETGLTMQRALLSFEPYLLMNRRTKNMVAHISINPDVQDSLSTEMYKELVDTYMDKMGYKDQPYVVFKHNDIDREHIHIVTLKIDSNGKKIDDKYEKIRSMNISRELEIQFGLKQITDKKSEEQQQFIKPIDYQKGDIKRQMSNTIRSVIESYKFQSLGEYNALLSCFNIQSKYVKGLDNDNLYHGIVYSTTDNEGNYISNRIKSSRLGKFAGYNTLTKAMLKTKENLGKQDVPYKAKSIIDNVKKESKSLQEFKDKLKEHKIDLLLRYNEEGRLYGVTFIDHNQKIAFNGSRIGKGYSANAMSEWFNGLPDTRQSIKPEGGGSQSKNVLTDSFSDEFLSGNTKNEKQENYTPEVSMDQVFGTSHVTAGTPDAEEEAFIRRMKRKKKKGRKR